MEEKKLVTCPECGSKVYINKFCPECGALYDKTASWANAMTNNNNQSCILQNNNKPLTPPEDNAPSDEGLVIIVDCCRKRIATVGGDGYSETCLYFDEKTNEYSIHTYSQYQPDNFLYHNAFKTTEEFKNKLLSFINEKGLPTYGKVRGGLCGAMYICKFLYNNEYLRYTTDDMGPDGPAIISSIHNYLDSGIDKENQLFKK